MAVRTAKDIERKLQQLEDITENSEGEYYLGVVNVLREETGKSLLEVDGTSSEYLRGIRAGEDWLNHEDVEIIL